MPSKIQKILPTDEIVIFVDSREMRTVVALELMKYKCIVKPKMLEVGDYILSDRVCVERKTYDDFISSIMDQRLFDQLRNLSDHFERPILLIEGKRETSIGMHANAIRGALASVAVDYGVPIMWTHDEADTAAMLFWIAKREQIDDERSISIRGKRKKMELHDFQEFIVAGFPKINRKTAKKLLKNFGSVESVFNASEEKLQEAPGIGKKLAKMIRNIITASYVESK